MMKNLSIVYILFGLLILSGCNQKTDTSALLKNQETKNEIFKAITNNDDYMAGFMETMQNNEHAMRMMQGNKMMMGNMMKGKGMQMMMQDSSMAKGMMGNKNMMHSMMQQMMADSTQMNGMMQIMHQNGIMSKECWQSCMKMMGKRNMNAKGMME
ncbi:MAG TPA: hypothetical protein VFD35_05260 [Pricia sp.]|nr:hypothetical protein [Pricia sp.]